MALHHKIEEDLSPAELDELRSWLREKNGTRTTDEVFEWCQARGFTGGRTSVGNWLAKFREEQMRERFSRSGELARAMQVAVDGGNFDAIASAANQQLVNVVFEQAAKMQADGEMDAEQVLFWTSSLKNLVGTKAQHTKLLAAKFDGEAKKLAAKREITQADIDEVRKAVFG